MSHVLKPIGDRLIVELIEPELIASGILLPENVEIQRPNEGVVIAVGIGRTENGVRIPLEVEVGDRVIISDYAGTDLRLEGRTFSILREHDVLTVIGKNYPFRKLLTYVAEEEPKPQPFSYPYGQKENEEEQRISCGKCAEQLIPKKPGIHYCSNCFQGHKVQNIDGNVYIDPLELIATNEVPNE